MGEAMQADGQGTKGSGDATGAGREGGGESGGGAYADKDQVKGDGKQGGFTGHGGQSDIGYRGPADPDADGENANAATEGA